MLRRCFPETIRRTLNELPESLDETYLRVLNEIGMANRDLAHRLLQCLTMAIRPLRLEELAEIIALDFDGAGGATPQLNEAWRSEDRQRDVLSTCSSLITLVGSGRSRVIQFSHFSVKESLTSYRLSTHQGDISRFHIKAEPAHVTLAQACLGTLLHHVSSNMKGYASQHWVEHAQFKAVASRIEVGLRRLFDLTEPYFAAWLQVHDIDDDRWAAFKAPDRGSPLYYASLCGLRDLAAHIIIEHPEQVNARSGRRHIPLTAALYNGHFDVVELLLQHGAAVDAPGYHNQTPLHVASADGRGDIARWLLDHGADPNSQEDDHKSPLAAALYNKHFDVAELLHQRGAGVDLTGYRNQTLLQVASVDGRSNVARWLLDHGANPNSQQEDRQSPIYLAATNGHPEVVLTLLGHGARMNAVDGAAVKQFHRAIVHGSLKVYEKRTKKDLIAHPLMAQFQTCSSPTDILAVLHTQVQGFEQSTSGDDKLTKWSNPTVNVLYPFLSAFGADVGLVNSIRMLHP